MAKIMIVDDEMAVRDMLAKILAAKGYKTVTAENGDDAIQKWTNERPDLVITDLIMPEKDGLEAVIEIKKIAPEARIIAYTGGGPFTPDELLHTAQLLGAQAVMAKPIEREELLKVVEKLLA